MLKLDIKFSILFLEFVLYYRFNYFELNLFSFFRIIIDNGKLDEIDILGLQVWKNIDSGRWIIENKFFKIKYENDIKNFYFYLFGFQLITIYFNAFTLSILEDLISFEAYKGEVALYLFYLHPMFLIGWQEDCLIESFKKGEFKIIFLNFIVVDNQGVRMEILKFKKGSAINFLYEQNKRNKGFELYVLNWEIKFGYKRNYFTILLFYVFKLTVSCSYTRFYKFRKYKLEEDIELKRIYLDIEYFTFSYSENSDYKELSEMYYKIYEFLRKLNLKNKGVSHIFVGENSIVLKMNKKDVRIEYNINELNINDLENIIKEELK